MNLCADGVRAACPNLGLAGQASLGQGMWQVDWPALPQSEWGNQLGVGLSGGRGH